MKDGRLIEPKGFLVERNKRNKPMKTVNNMAAMLKPKTRPGGCCSAFALAGAIASSYVDAIMLDQDRTADVPVG